MCAGCRYLTSLVAAALWLGAAANPDAKRLYDDLLSRYNRLIRPVGNNSDTITVKMGLRLSQLIDVVSSHCSQRGRYRVQIRRGWTKGCKMLKEAGYSDERAIARYKLSGCDGSKEQ